MKKFLYIIIFYLGCSAVHSIESKIIYSIQNEIITSIDIKNEFKYLLALNNNLRELDKEQILDISAQSIIREEIKKIEILKNFKELDINPEYLDLLIKNMYLNLDLKTLNEFELYLKDYDLALEDIEMKITIDALWNELIVQKYSGQIIINEEMIMQKIRKNTKTHTKEYQLSEIIFEVKNKEEIENKYKEIIRSIDEIGFKNSASIYSFSESAKIGGDIGWINENSLNNIIKENINKLQEGQNSKPIILPNGILILNVVKIRDSKIKIDYKSDLKKAINYEKNRQLNQYSKIYYNKIKKNLNFDG